MNQPGRFSDEEFLRRFLACALEPSDFDHRGHLRAAWLVLRHHPVDEAVEHTCDGIARLAAKFGAPGKFNRTMSEALVRLMAHGGAADPGASLDEFLGAHPEFDSDVRGVLARHYSDDRLHSPEARARFVAPDRQGLPR